MAPTMIKMTKVTEAFCRGCGRDFEVEREMGEYFVEKIAKASEHLHPKVDCDGR